MKTRTLVLVGALVVAGLIVSDQLGRMHPRFFGPSPSAVRGLVHYLAGDYAGAARLYREALRITAARSAAAPPSWSAFVRGSLEEAEAQARIESALAPQDPEPRLTLAEIALARRDPVTALGHAARVLALRRDDYDASLIGAVAHAKQGDFHAAIAMLKRALRYDHAERRPSVFLAVLEATGDLGHLPVRERPSCLLAHLHRYLRIYDPSQARPAIRYARRAIEVGDDVDDAYVTLGIVDAKQGRARQALAAFQQALAVNPRNTAALLAAARLRANRGEVDEEYRLVRGAFEAGRDDRFVVAVMHGFLVDKLGDYRQALALAETAVAADPRDGEAWWRRAHVQAQLGRHPDALQSYQRAAALLPATIELRESIAARLDRLGRTEDAMAAYREAVALAPWRPGPHLGLGALHSKARRWAEAIQEHETFVRLGGGLPVGLCELYLETGRPEAATSCATAILTVDPDNLRALSVIEHARRPRLDASRGQ